MIYTLLSLLHNLGYLRNVPVGTMDDPAVLIKLSGMQSLSYTSTSIRGELLPLNEMTY